MAIYHNTVLFVLCVLILMVYYKIEAPMFNNVLNEKEVSNKKREFLKKYIRHVLLPPPVEYKEYKNNQSVKLPRGILPHFLLKDALENRKTVREFSQRKLSLRAISTILYYGFGLNTRQDKEDHRHYPSAGGKYPLECYLINNKTRLKDGIYHYNVRDHSLEIINSNVPTQLDVYIPQLAKIKSSLILIITGIVRRTTQKYGVRGKRYLLLEAGHIGQTIQLLSCALGMNSIPMGGGFQDKKIEQLIGVKHSVEPLIYMFTLGYAKH